MAKRSAIQALGFGFLAAFFWGTHSVIVRYLTGDLHGMTIAVFRLYIALLALYAIMRLCRHPIVLKWTDKTILITAFGVTSNFIFFHIGLEHTGAADAMLLENTAPLFVLAFLFFVMRESIRKVEILATLLTVVGVVFTVRGDLFAGGEGLTGDLYEIIAGATWAIFIMGSSRALGSTDSTLQRINFLFNVFLISAIALTPFLFVYPPQLTLTDTALLLALGIFPTAVANYLWCEAAARVSTVSASLLFTLSIIFTFINASLFLGEVITLDRVIGATLIISGVLLSKWKAADS